MTARVLAALRRLAIASLAMLPATAVANDMLAEAQKLYAAAFYERALAAIEEINPQQTVELRDQQTIRRYKALCLIALDRGDEAARVVTEIVAAEPMASGNPADPPRLRDLVLETRRRVVPGIARELFARGRQHFLQKAFTEASADFASVVALVDDPTLGLASLTELADLRLLAGGFLELSRNADSREPTAGVPPLTPEGRAPAAEPRPPTPEGREPAADARPQAAGCEAPNADCRQPAAEVVPPVAIVQELPPVPYVLRQVLRQPREGAIEVTVSVDGSVESATVVTPSHPTYDALLLAAARSWTYRPALRGGVPVAYTKRIRAVFPN